MPFLYGSATTGQRVRKILDMVIEMAESRKQRVATAEVNKVLQALLERASPPQKAGDEVKLLYATQIESAPPTIVIISNRPDDIPESYQRYLIRGLLAGANGGLSDHHPAQVQRRGSKQ